MDYSEIFVYYFQAPIVLVFGLIGNSIVFLYFSYNKTQNIGPKNMYSYLFIFDTLFLLTILNYYLIKAIDINLTIKSSLACNIFMYFMYTIAPVSSSILVYILIERYLSIKYPVESNFLRKSSIQLAYLVGTISFNLVYSIVAFSYDVVILFENGSKELDISKGNNSSDIGCYFINSDKKTAISNLTIIHKIVLPSFYSQKC